MCIKNLGIKSSVYFTCLYQVRVITVFIVFRLLTDFVLEFGNFVITLICIFKINYYYFLYPFFNII
jgi:hypothetical protein